MNALPLSCVVDASIGIKLFVPEEHSEDVQSLFERSLADPAENLFVPDLFFVECANIVWKKVRWRGYPVDAARKVLAGLRLLNLSSMPTEGLMERALEIACAHSITAYDACYLALSERVGLPLLTADDRLPGHLPRGVFNVMVLGS